MSEEVIVVILLCCCCLIAAIGGYSYHIRDKKDEDQNDVDKLLWPLVEALGWDDSDDATPTNAPTNAPTNTPTNAPTNAPINAPTDPSPIVDPSIKECSGWVGDDPSDGPSHLYTCADPINTACMSRWHSSVYGVNKYEWQCRPIEDVIDPVTGEPW